MASRNPVRGFTAPGAAAHMIQPHGPAASGRQHDRNPGTELGLRSGGHRADRQRVARTARLIAATMLCSGVVALTGLAISVAAVVWTGLIAGCLAWLSIPLWLLALGRALAPSRAALPIPGTAISAHRRET